MTAYSVGFAAEVLAVVEDGVVQRVIVMDEHLTLNGKVYDAAGVEVTGSEADEAMRIADGNSEWPVWEFGW